MQEGIAPVDQLTACRLSADARGLAAALAALGPSGRRHVRALDRWYARFAADVREHQELLQVEVLPVLGGRGIIDEELLEALAADHAWIDELVGDLGDAIGILAFGLGEPGLWLGRATVLADLLADLLGRDADRQADLLAGLEATDRDTLALRPRRLETLVNRFRPDPIGAITGN